MILREFLEDSCLILLGLVPNSNDEIPLALLIGFFFYSSRFYITDKKTSLVLSNMWSNYRFKKKMLLLLFLIEFDFCHLVALVIE